LPIGFAINSEIPPGGPKDKEGSFLLGIELLPVVVEYRF
jgi:hypothetical protein